MQKGIRPNKSRWRQKRLASQRGRYGLLGHAATSELPFQPQYETTAPSREPLLLTLAGLGLAGALCGALSLSGIYHAGWLVPLCAVFAAGPAWVLAYKDLGEMHLGGRDASGRSPTLLALWLGALGMLACILAVATMIWLEMSPFPDIV